MALLIRYVREYFQGAQEAPTIEHPPDAPTAGLPEAPGSPTQDPAPFAKPIQPGGTSGKISPIQDELPAQRKRSKQTPGRHALRMENGLPLTTPERFIAALQKAADLWAMRKQVLVEKGQLYKKIKHTYSNMTPDIVHLERISSKAEPSFQNQITMLEYRVEAMSDALEGGDGLLAQYDRAENRRCQVLALQEILHRRISQASQQWIDESRESGLIGKLKVTRQFCSWMVKIRECDAALERLRVQQNVALRRQLELSNPAKTANDAADLEQQKLQANAEFRRLDVLLRIEKTNQSDRQSHWVRAGIIPALQESGLLNTTFVSPDDVTPAVPSSADGLSPLKDRYGPGGMRDRETTLHPVQQDWIRASKEHQAFVEELSRFEAEYQNAYIDFLYTYTGQDKAIFEATALRTYGAPYADICSRGRKNIEAARQRLEQASERVIAAGLELPPQPPFEEEKPIVDKARDRRIRKHGRDVARGKLKSPPRSPVSIRTSSSVRTNRSNALVKDPYEDWRTRMKEEIILKQKATYPAAYRAYRKRWREMWLARMKFTNRAYALKSPHPVPKMKPWRE